MGDVLMVYCGSLRELSTQLLQFLRQNSEFTGLLRQLYAIPLYSISNAVTLSKIP